MCILRNVRFLTLLCAIGILSFTLVKPTSGQAGATQDDTIWCMKAKDLAKVSTAFSISNLLSVAGNTNPHDCAGKAKLRSICLSASRELGDDPRGGAIVVGHACYKVRCDGAALQSGPLFGPQTLTTVFGAHMTDLSTRSVHRGTNTVCVPIAEIP